MLFICNKAATGRKTVTMSSEKSAWLKPVLEPLKPVFRELLATSFFVNMLALVVPIFTMQVYDRVVYHAGISTLQGLAIGVLLLLVFDLVLRSMRARVMQTVALRIDVLVGKRLFDKLVALPLRTLETKPAAFWQLLFRDVDMIRNTLSGASAILLADLPFVVIFLVVIFIIAEPIAWVLTIASLSFVALAWHSGRSMQQHSEKERNVQTARDTLISEIIAGRGTVKALALERALRPIWEDRQAETIEQALSRGNSADVYVNLGQSMTMLTSMALTTVGALFIIDQKLTMGGLVASNMLISRLLGPVNQLVGAWKNFSAFRQSIERLGETFATLEDRTETVLQHPRPRGVLTLEGICFQYDEKSAPALDDVSMTFPTGSMTAVLGRNGSGKSTMLKIVLGLYKPASGRVLLDGGDVGQFNRTELATWLGYVPQECVLFNGTVRDNVAYAKPDATDEEILRAAQMAGVHQYIVDLPDGYGTQIGEAGQRLSAGQRQRLAIARALIGDPPVLLLDEPSSSLDRQAEEDLKNTLAGLAQHHTVVVVTHSPILLPACRQVVLLDKGKVAASGPPSEVMRWLAAAQQKAQAEAAAAQAAATAPVAPAAVREGPVPAQMPAAVPAKVEG
jgi:ATP-binding cassette subfamily C protein LapB